MSKKVALSFKDKLLLNTLIVLAVGFFIYLVGDILLPFVVAIITAYFLDPAADKLENSGFSRTLATLSITSIFFVILAVVLVLLVPVLYEQLLGMAEKIPSYIRLFNDKILPSVSIIINKIDPNASENIRESISSFSGEILSFIASLAKNVFNSGLAIVNILSLIFITPIVTFYTLRDWDKLKEKVKSLLPKESKKTIITQSNEIDKTLSGYIRGQTNVCLLLGIFYGVGLTMVGLDFGLFIGIATGILSFIPYVGVLFGFVVGLTVAFFQFGDYMNMSIIAAIFLVGQFLEGTFVTPNLVGDKVGLHPIWVIFGLLAGGSIFGFVGILIAVPVTAVIGVIIRFYVANYEKKLAS